MNAGTSTQRRRFDWVREFRLDLALFNYALIGSVVTGFVAVYVDELLLPPNDGAYGLGLRIFNDPFVVGVMSMICAVGFVYAFALGRVCLAKCNVHRAALVVYAIVLATTVTATVMLHHKAELLAPFIALTLSMIFCRVTRWSFVAARRDFDTVAA